MVLVFKDFSDFSNVQWPVPVSQKLKEGEDGEKGDGEKGDAEPFEEGKGRVCFNLFCYAGPQMSTPELHELCRAAWAEDAALCLDLIFWMGSVDCESEQSESNEGGDKKGRERMQRFTFYRAMLWLFNHHPETFLLNTYFIPKHASLGALLDLLMFVFHQGGKSKRKYGLASLVTEVDYGEDWRARCSILKLQDEFQTLSAVRETVFADLCVVETEQDALRGSESALLSPSAAKVSLSLLAAQRQLFYSIVADLFAGGLASELREYTVSGRVGGYFALQAPSPQRMHDKATNIVD
eukprot:2193223-Rhodomonas_salina.1